MNVVQIFIKKKIEKLKQIDDETNWLLKTNWFLLVYKILFLSLFPYPI